jgi:hypothetical protein
MLTKSPGVENPEGKQVLAILKLKSHWRSADEDGIEMFDFSLPGEVSDYVLSVSFDETGAVDDISMES